ncbi:protein archease-like [Toxorhynchites rutilus septentrionalis]|uniref:protein archease-like n=1 Tax=Toxorhynchites rutilus septentrionalis TaxID=329112 RepID=UPI00247998B6|nr:protein archease-like [Toxorhynchites rutilus septentrionalis]
MEIPLESQEHVIPDIKHEYLDHTADVQLHAWGTTLKEAFEQCGMAMFGYMTELPTVDIKTCYEIKTEPTDDLENLLFRFLDELLFLFSAEPFLICKKIEITKFDMENFYIVCRCYGEEFDLKKHPQGTEVKAITYSAMQIHQMPEQNKCEVFVIIDI